MGDWPTSGTRGQSQASSGGYPGAGAAMAAGGFLAPGAAAAMEKLSRGAMPRVPLPAAPPPQTASPMLARTAAGALRVPFPWPLLAAMAAAYAAWRLWEWYAARKGGKSLGDWEILSDCGRSPDLLSGSYWNGNCALRTYFAPATWQPFTRNPEYFWKDDGPGFIAGTRYALPAIAYRMVAAPGRTVTNSVKPSDLPPGLMPQPVVHPRRFVDPLTRPGVETTDAPPVLPYRLLPDRIPNPWRSPVESPDRGNTPRPGVAVPLPGEPDPGVSPDPVFPPAPAREPVRPGWPVEDLPGWVADPRPGVPHTPSPGAPAPGPGVAPGTRPGPGVAPTPGPGAVPGPVTPSVPGPGTATPPGGAQQPGRVEPDAPPITSTKPSTAAGPTISIGGGPPVGPHMRAPPRKREKERKARWLAPGRALVIRKVVNPATEFLDAAECAWKSLPKQLRWQIMKEDWKRQKAEGRTVRPKETVRDPETGRRTEFQNSGAKVEFGARGSLSIGGVEVLPEGGIPSQLRNAWPEGQSLTLPHTTQRGVSKYVDLNANHIQPLSPQAKMAAVYRHYDQMDLDGFVKCVGVDQLEDLLIGRTNQLLNKGWHKASRSPMGLGTGPTF